MFHRADLVPVYSFGENELFQQVIFPDGSLGRRLQDLFKKAMGFAPCLFVGERMALVPYKIPITIVGKPAVALHSLTLTNILFFSCWKSTFFSSGKTNPCTKTGHTHRRRSGPLSWTLHGSFVQVIPWTQAQLWTSWRSQTSDHLDFFPTHNMDYFSMLNF